MSRIAGAYRKSGGGFLGVSGVFNRECEAGLGTEFLASVDVPWDLGPPTPSAPWAAHRGGIQQAESPTGQRRTVEVGSPSSAELMPVVQRILTGGTHESRLRSVLFVAVGCQTAPDICAAAADALAHQTTGTVCAVDSNIDSPSLHVSFGVDGSPGFSNLLLDGEDCRQVLTRLTPNLWLVPAGPGGGPLALVGGTETRRCLDDLLETFDYVLLDAPPINGHFDIASLGQMVDGVVLVLDARTTRREVAKKTADHLHNLNITIVGAVFTNRSFPIPEAIYRML